MFEVAVATVVAHSTFAEAGVAIAYTEPGGWFDNSAYSEYMTLKRFLADLEAFRDDMYVCLVS
jgi:hypothetical protein